MTIQLDVKLTEMGLEDRLKFGPFLTIYNKDYIKKKLKRFYYIYCKSNWFSLSKICSQERPVIKQEFEDPVCESFKNYLVLDKNAPIKPPSEPLDDYLEKVSV